MALTTTPDLRAYPRELRLGKRRGAVDAGFDRATLTTSRPRDTLIARRCLPVRTGRTRLRRVTLSLGVVASIHAAVSRLVFDYILNTQKVKTISILKRTLFMSIEISNPTSTSTSWQAQVRYTFSWDTAVLVSVPRRPGLIRGRLRRGSIVQVKSDSVPSTRSRTGCAPRASKRSVQKAWAMQGQRILIRTDTMETGQISPPNEPELAAATGAGVESQAP